MAEVTNANGIIAAAANNQAVENKQKSPSSIMKGILDNDNTKKLLQDSLKENAGAFAASILDLYNIDKYLQQCDPKQVFGECLKAVSLKLPINKQLGFAYVVAFKGIPQFQIGYKGLIQLCMRTGQYKHINAGEVYEGEYKGFNKLTGELDISGERTSNTIVGYFAYMETLNGFSHSVYCTKQEVQKHAEKYSKSHNSSNSAWKTEFDKMAVKTVLRNLLSHYGYMSVEMMNAMTAEQPSDTDTLSENTDNTVNSEVIDVEYTESNDEAINDDISI